MRTANEKHDIKMIVTKFLQNFIEPLNDYHIKIKRNQRKNLKRKIENKLLQETARNNRLKDINVT